MIAAANLLAFLGLLTALLVVWRQSRPARLRLFTAQSAFLAVLACVIGVCEAQHSGTRLARYQGGERHTVEVSATLSLDSASNLALGERSFSFLADLAFPLGDETSPDHFHERTGVLLLPTRVSGEPALFALGRRHGTASHPTHKRR